MLVMAAVTTPGMAFLGASDALDAPETPLLRYYWLPIYAAIVALAAWRWRFLARALVPCLLAGGLVAWAWMSKDWSVLPDISSRRAIALAFTTLLGLYLGARFGGAKLPVMLSDTFLVLCVGSIIAAIATPSIGIQHDGETSGAWRGLFFHKNALGSWMVLGSLSAAAAAFLDPVHRRRHWLTLGLCVFAILMCRSKGVLVTWLEVMSVAAVLAAARRGPVWAVSAVWFAGAAAIVLSVVLILDPAAILHALGKSETLTGRTEIWASVNRRIAENPWFGYGFAAFWEKGSVPADFVKKETGWLVPNAHNGWLDLLLQVGWLGVGALILVVIVAAIGCLLRSRARSDGYFGLLFFVFYMSTALSESALEEHNSLLWALFVAVLVFACCGAPASGPKGRVAPEGAAMAPQARGFDWASLDAPRPLS